MKNVMSEYIRYSYNIFFQLGFKKYVNSYIAYGDFESVSGGSDWIRVQPIIKMDLGLTNRIRIKSLAI